MLNIVIFGAPGSGKGTQSELIIKEYGLDHISTGDVLRSEMKNETELGKIAKDYIEKGQLVPDELIVDMLAKVLDSKVNSKGVIFDGFPRTIPQAKALKEMLNKRGTDVSVMLNLQVEEEELINRLLERGKVSGRSDDNLETIKSRLDVYHKQTAPLADYYIGEGKHVAIKGYVFFKGNCAFPIIAKTNFQMIMEMQIVNIPSVILHPFIPQKRKHRTSCRDFIITVFHLWFSFSSHVYCLLSEAVPSFPIFPNNTGHNQPSSHNTRSAEIPTTAHSIQKQR